MRTLLKRPAAQHTPKCSPVACPALLPLPHHLWRLLQQHRIPVKLRRDATGRACVSFPQKVCRSGYPTGHSSGRCGFCPGRPHHPPIFTVIVPICAQTTSTRRHFQGFRADARPHNHTCTPSYDGSLLVPVKASCKQLPRSVI